MQPTNLTPIIVIVILITGGIALTRKIGSLNRDRHSKILAAAAGKIEITDEGCVYIQKGNPKKTIKWRDLIEVSIITTDQGPFIDDVYFHLRGPTENQELRIPQGAVGTDRLVERLQALPKFQNEEMIKAMTSTANNHFICWKKG
jgi:hypothetical protein